MHTRLALTPLATFLVASAPFAIAQQSITTESQKLTASDAGEVEHFGRAVALSGKTAVIGADRDAHEPGGYFREGSAYVLERQGVTGAWGEVAKLTASDAEIEDGFGWSVAVAGDTVVVGSYRDSHQPGMRGGWSSEGAAYVFERDEGGSGVWGEVVKLVASDAAFSDEFGFSVALSGGTAIIGAPQASGGGGAYVFDRDQGGAGAWGEVIRLTASNTVCCDDLGWCVALSGDTAVVGAPRSNNYEGSAFVFERNEGGPGAWGEVRQLTVSFHQAGAYDPGFGSALAISGDTVIVGAPRDTPDWLSWQNGSAHVFGRDQGGMGAWGEVQKLIASDTSNEDWFGSSVAVSGDMIVVGAATQKIWVPSFKGKGVAYVFERNQGGAAPWSETGKLQASDGGGYNTFGSSAALFNGTALIGAWDDGHNGLPIWGVSALALDPATGTLWGAELGSRQLLTIDPATGLSNPVGALGFKEVRGLAFDPTTRTLYGADTASDRLITIDTVTGAGTAVGPLGFTKDQDVEAMAFDPGAGVLYGCRSPKSGSTATYKLVTIDTATGTGSVVGPTGFPDVRGLAFDPGTNALYGVDAKTDELFTIDTATGAGTVVGPLVQDDYLGLTFDSATGNLAGTAGWPDRLVTIDPVTAGEYVVGTASTYFDGSGSAYVFGLPLPTETYCTAGISASGCRATLSALGIPSATASSGFALVASNVEGGKSGVFFHGTGGRQAVPWGNGTSFKCIVPPVRRGGLMGGVGPLGGCNGSFTLDLNARWCPTCPKPSHNPGAGSVVQAQLWYLDPFSTDNQTTSFSDAVEFYMTP